MEGQKAVALRSWRHSGRRRMCIKLLSFFWCSIENFEGKSQEIPRILGEDNGREHGLAANGTPHQGSLRT